MQARYFALINPIVVKGGNTHVPVELFAVTWIRVVNKPSLEGPMG